MKARSTMVLKAFTCFALCAALVGCEKYALDKQMAELCKKDGGVEIYETVTLPHSAFDATGYLIRKSITDPNKPLTSVSIVQGGEYSISRETNVIKAGEPFTGDGAGFISEGRLERTLITVTRLFDSKILGTLVIYGRAGGGFSLGHSDSKMCPATGPDFIETMFKQGA